MGACAEEGFRAAACRERGAATQLKMASMAVIFATSVVGITAPVLLARLFRGGPTHDKAILVIKCFAAGVVLSTSLVHVLPEAYAALSDCAVASRRPWRDFPFAGLLALLGALLALLVDVAATSHVHQPNYAPVVTEKKLIVSRPDPERDAEEEEQEELAKLKMKQRLVSQVLEIGIIFHSVIIGLTMGMSQNQCTIKPLVAALSFHQIFEGMGLGGCIAQAGFDLGSTAYMSFMFSVTTPMGIALGMILFSLTGYDDSSPNALIMEGLLGSLSSGVLIYMALVDLIATDFFHNKAMNDSVSLKKAAYIALTLGSASMSVLAIWA